MREKINLQELTTLLSDKAEIPKKDADAFLREFFGLMTDSLIEDKQVKIRNLGTFKLIDVEDRESINVRTGERVLIPAHTKVSYIQDKALNDIINKSHEESEPKNTEEMPSVSEITNTPEDEEVKHQENIQPNKEEKVEEESASKEEAANSKETLLDDVSEEISGERKKQVKIILFTSLTIALLMVIFYFLSRENNDITNYTVQPQKTAFDLTQEEENNEDDSYAAYRDSEAKINSTDTVIPIKQTWIPGKKRKTKVGERLTLISFQEYGDVVFWIYIYEENKHLISKDNYVKAGIDIRIPPPEKYDIDAKNSNSLQKARDFAKNYNKDN